MSLWSRAELGMCLHTKAAALRLQCASGVRAALLIHSGAVGSWGAQGTKTEPVLWSSAVCSGNLVPRKVCGKEKRYSVRNIW